jgi:hypothetical protein
MVGFEEEEDTGGGECGGDSCGVERAVETGGRAALEGLENGSTTQARSWCDESSSSIWTGE